MCGLYQTLVNEFSRLVARGRQNRFDIRHPDELLLFEILLQHTAQSGRTGGCPDHERVNADGNNSRFSRGIGLSLPRQKAAP